MFISGGADEPNVDMGEGNLKVSTSSRFKGSKKTYIPIGQTCPSISAPSKEWFSSPVIVPESRRERLA
jgi:hypothetical protein